MLPIKKTSIFVCLCLLISILAYYQPTAYSQDNEESACTDLVTEALQTVGTACAEIGRNQACYGHNAINVVPVEDAQMEFSETGDTADIADFMSLETQPANPQNGTWGIAFISVQADLPNDSDEYLTFVLIGDTSLSADTAFEDTSTQAFTVQSSVNETCTDAPDGLLIRSPEGQRARVLINGVELVMSSTLFITAQDDDEMVLQGLDGEIEVTAQGQTETLESGFTTSIPLDDLIVDGPPATPALVEPDVAFPLDILTGLLPDAASSTSSSGSTNADLPQTYSDESLTFNFPDGWAVQAVPATEFLGAYIALSNNPAYLEVNLTDPSTSGNTAPDTVFVLIYTLAEFSGGQYTSSNAAVQGLIDSIGTNGTHDIIEAPTTITLGSHTVIRAQIGFNFAQDTWDGPIYGLGDFVIAIRVTPGEYANFQPMVEEILASFIVE